MNQAIHQYFLNSNHEKKLNQIITHQYTMLKAFSMLIEAFHSLLLANKKIPKTFVPHLLLALNKLHQALATCHINTQGKFITGPNDFDGLIKNLNETLTHVILDDNQVIVSLLNIKLSLRLLIKNYNLLCLLN